MGPEELAKLIAAELYSGSGPWFFLICAVVFSGAGAYLGQYLGEKGKNLATREDFQALQQQLGANTTLVEQIRSDIERADWAKREWAALRMKKIEELMTRVHECDSHLATFHHEAIGGNMNLERDPLDPTVAVAELYVPELRENVLEYVSLARNRLLEIAETAAAVMAKRKGDPLYCGASEWDALRGKQEFQNCYGEMLQLRDRIRESAARLLREIAGAE